MILDEKLKLQAPLSIAIFKEYNRLTEIIISIPSKNRTKKKIQSTHFFISVSNILAYQIGWGNLLIGWYKEGLKDKIPIMPGEGFTTWDYVARLLLDAGLPVDPTSEMGLTPLHIASTAEITSLLIERGADITKRDNDGRTPLHFANNPASVMLLLQGRGEKKADVHAVDDQGRTPLHRPSSVAVAVKLLENGANINAQDRNGQTPLHVALGGNDSWFKRLFILKGADVNMPDAQGKTPLQYELSRYTPDKTIVELLLKHGAKLDVVNEKGQTPLFTAIEKRDEALLRLILKYNPDLKYQDKTGNTPLSLAERHYDDKWKATAKSIIEGAINRPAVLAAKQAEAAKQGMPLLFQKSEGKSEGKVAGKGAVQDRGLEVKAAEENAQTNKKQPE